MDAPLLGSDGSINREKKQGRRNWARALCFCLAFITVVGGLCFSCLVSFWVGIKNSGFLFFLVLWLLKNSLSVKSELSGYAK